MPDRHKRAPTAVRLPDGLEAWLRDHAAQTGQSISAVIVQALEAFRQAAER
jgi:hypothetical protein